MHEGNRIVRRALLPADAEGIMQVFAAAKAIMVSTGNVNQWREGYPSLEVVESDIERNGSYVIEQGGRIVAYFAFLASPDPTYATIYDGKWLDDTLPYHVIHRIASYPEVHGIFDSIIDFCSATEPNLRIDTHKDNHIMQHVIEKHGFTYCGIIHIVTGDERLAYQRVETDLSFTTEKFTAEIDAKEYINGFRRTEYFVKLCQQCGNYGRRYGCPPFDEKTLSLIDDYQKVRIIGVKIIPQNKQLPLKSANDLMKPVIAEMNEELLELEESLGGYAFGFVGSCPYCGGAPCARISGKPCRHPEKVRPSLEAFGFDMSKTAKDLLGLETKWSQDELIPEYLTLVCGLFYQKSK